MSGKEWWLAAAWPVVRDRLPDPPARVLEIGCGPLGGFVPMLSVSGYEAVGVDPEAPDEASYRRVEFEQGETFRDVDVVVAATSLHHVADPAEVLDRVASALAPRRTLIVLEWDWDRFDEPTAEWCFRRLGTGEEPSWVQRRRDEWMVSGQPWNEYLRTWAEEEGLHAWESLRRLLDERFHCEEIAYGPYFFPELAATSDEDERAAIEGGQIQAARVDYVGSLSS